MSPTPTQQYVALYYHMQGLLYVSGLYLGLGEGLGLDFGLG